jgi:ELWxxDGT repeat protein
MNRRLISWMRRHWLAGSALLLGGAIGLMAMRLHAMENAPGAVERHATDWQVAEIYMATVGYAPDNEGLQYWVEQIETRPEWDPTTVAQSFFDQPLIQQQYPEDQGYAFLIESLYQNIFGRDPDADGKAYWLAELEAGRVQRNQMIVALINGGWASTDPTAEQDMARFGHLVEVSLAFASAQAERGIVSSELTEVKRNALRRAGALALVSVTSDPATRDAAIARIPALLDEVVATGSATVPVEWLAWFESVGPNDCDYYRTDGTAAGTLCLADYMNGDLYAIDEGKWVFQAAGSTNLTDGTSDGNRVLVDSILPSSANWGWRLSANNAAIGNGKMIVESDTRNMSTSDNEPALLDAENTGIRMIKDINPVAGHGSDPQEITAIGNGKAVFSAYSPDGDDREPWVTDGTEAGTVRLADISPIDHIGVDDYEFTPLGNGKAVFHADDGVNGFGPWVTDGTPVGTALLKVVPVRYISGRYGMTQNMAFASLEDGRAVFVALEGERPGPWSLYITDGTSAGTKRLFGASTGVVSLGAGCRPGYAFFNVADLTGDTNDYNGLWLTDGTAAGTVRLTDADFWSVPNQDYQACLGNDSIIFMGQDDAHGLEPWITDGTPGGTRLVKDIYPGESDSILGGLSSLGDGRALFCAKYPFDPDGELWITDGTESGTQPFKDVEPNLAAEWNDDGRCALPRLTPYRLR